MTRGGQEAIGGPPGDALRHCNDCSGRKSPGQSRKAVPKLLTILQKGTINGHEAFRFTPEEVQMVSPRLAKRRAEAGVGQDGETVRSREPSAAAPHGEYRFDPHAPKWQANSTSVPAWVPPPPPPPPPPPAWRPGEPLPSPSPGDASQPSTAEMSAPPFWSITLGSILGGSQLLEIREQQGTLRVFAENHSEVGFVVKERRGLTKVLQLHEHSRGQVLAIRIRRSIFRKAVDVTDSGGTVLGRIVRQHAIRTSHRYALEGPNGEHIGEFVLEWRPTEGIVAHSFIFDTSGRDVARFVCSDDTWMGSLPPGPSNLRAMTVAAV
jgi:hypothetical protein